MSRIIIDDNLFQVLRQADQPVVLVNAQGQSIGQLVPALAPTGSAAEPGVSEEELDRLEQAGGGRSLTAILADLDDIPSQQHGHDEGQSAENIALPLDAMTVEEKLAVMELIWADLSKNASSVPSPDWHKDILRERRQAVAEGKVGFTEWNTALAQLRGELRGNSPT
jgi:hypothetical protein